MLRIAAIGLLRRTSDRVFEFVFTLLVFDFTEASEIFIFDVLNK